MSSYAASFDCAKAVRPQDKMICANPQLSQADNELADLYKKTMELFQNKATLKESQLAWLKTRDACKNLQCMLMAYQQRISVLQRMLSDNSIEGKTAKMPAKQAGTYPVWVSPELGVKSLSEQDIDAALKRKFWDNQVYRKDFKNQVDYLRAHQGDKNMPINCESLAELIK